MDEKIIDICDELHQNFIDYAYEVNSQRAFPDARDGLKPSQRASLWVMYESKYFHNKPHVKCAKITGKIIGNYHPHGDQAAYETFARMSQSWINNVPEVDWHGANGSISLSPEPAHQRYTEARLSEAAQKGMFCGIEKKNVPFILNFSEDLEWPEVLPSVFPRLIVNGCQGIGYTIANVWLPHNLGEVVELIKNYVTSGELNYDNFYPDFPSGGIIINKDEISSIYETGKGKVILRGKVTIKGNHILITELPYQVYVEPFIASIKELIINDEITDIEDIINKNDCLVDIECKTNPELVLQQLYNATDLQKNYNANQFALVGKTPVLLNLRQYLDVYIHHNLACIRNEAKFDLEKNQLRLEVLEGLLLALEDIDNVIALIKASKTVSDAKLTLREKYNLTERQATTIVDMKLGRLANMEKIALENEQKKLEEESEGLKALLLKEELRKEKFLERLLSFAKSFSSPRKTKVENVELAKRTTGKKSKEEIIENCIVSISYDGLIYRSNIKTISYPIHKFNCTTADKILLFSSEGTMHVLKVKDIPNEKKQNISNFIHNGGKTKILFAALDGEEISNSLIFVTKSGLVKKTTLSDYFGTIRSSKNGIQAIKLNEGDSVVSVAPVNDEDIVICTNEGHVLRISTKDINLTGKVTKGMKGISLTPSDSVSCSTIVKDTHVLLVAEDGTYYKLNINEVPVQTRATRGKTLNNKIVGIESMSDAYMVVIIHSSGILKCVFKHLDEGEERLKDEGKSEVKGIEYMRKII